MAACGSHLGSRRLWSFALLNSSLPCSADSADMLSLAIKQDVEKLHDPHCGRLCVFK